MENTEKITITYKTLYRGEVKEEIKVGDTVIRKDKGGFYTFAGLTSNGMVCLWDGQCAYTTTIDNLRR